jgi:hypothetical protein
MKKYKIVSSVFLVAVMLISNGCSDLLVENPQSKVVPAVFGTPAGLLGGISGVYNQLRSSWGTEGFTIQQMAGTDEQLAGGSAGGSLVYFTYNGLTGSNSTGGFGLYTSINTLNGILEIGPTAPGLSDETLKAYLGQAQFLRAFIYFHLVQTYGNIPLNTAFITVPSQAASPAVFGGGSNSPLPRRLSMTRSTTSSGKYFLNFVRLAISPNSAKRGSSNTMR